MNLGNFKNNDLTNVGILRPFVDNFPVIANEMPMIKIPVVKINLISSP
jgi:hypothetical protein